MGNTTSTANIGVLNANDLEIDQNTYDSLDNNCTGALSGQNVVNISNNSGSIIQNNQKNEVRNLCLVKNVLNNNKTIDQQAKLLNDLNTKLQATGGFPAASTYSSQMLQNYMKLKMSQNDYTQQRVNCINNLNSDNIANITNNAGTFVSNSQVNSAYNQCLFDYAKTNNILSKAQIDEVNKAVTDQQATGYNFFGGLASFLIPLVCCIVCIIILWMMLRGGSSGGTTSINVPSGSGGSSSGSGIDINSIMNLAKQTKK